MNAEERRFKPDFPLLLLGCLAVGWAIARACVQSVTLDEADSYLLFAAPRDWPSHWYASSANHVLNSILERIFTGVFGLSHLTLRLPALIGGAIYVAAAYALCTRISSRRAIRGPLFACLVFNPFVMDYMVAARGYGLALGLLMASVWAMTESRFAAASICAGLSFCANFSFAYVDAALILFFAIWGWRETRDWRTPARAVAPGAAIAFLICGWTVWTFPRAQLYWGAPHLKEMWQSIVANTFDDLNPFLVHPLLAAGLEVLRGALPWLLAAVLIWQALTVLWVGQPLGRIVVRAVAVALLCHWLALRLFHIPLPLARTGIFFVPLAMLVIGIGAASGSKSRMGACGRFASIGVLSLCAFYFAGCLRLSHFREWKFDADVKEVFGVLETICRRDGIREVATDWQYTSPLIFYFKYFQAGPMPEFPRDEPQVPGKRVYVLDYKWAEQFIRSQGLQVVYRGRLSSVAVAVRPGS